MNRLKDEPSLYLRQHADNPVDWYPWGDEALTAAREQNKPILLSVGYSACHWCHVMAHESFEDQATADVMNRLFINVKVDREERPDIDRIYQTAHQLMAQRPGGWPLTMFLTPDQQLPFFGGTYFPSEPRYGMPAFTDVMQRVAQYFDTHPDEVAKQGDALRSVFPQLEPTPDPDALIDDAPLRLARDQIEASFDAEYGGFGTAPKFPQTPILERMLRHWRASAGGDRPDLQALFISTLSQTRMAEGGLFDQVGGGFYRYCVDQHWEIPHFEKMLYDNGPLLALYADTWRATGDTLFRDAAARTAAWLLREMRDTGGAFYATLDADSEGHEGLFYTWTPDEVREAVGDEAFAVLEPHFGLDLPANFEGRWHLRVARRLEDIAGGQQATREQLDETVRAACATLLAGRDERVRPGRDEKILTSWNALAIRGLAVAARGLGDDELTRAARDAANFIADRLWQNGRLHASWQQGEARRRGYLDDHAFLLDALLELLQNEWRGSWLRMAVTLADALLERFEDRDSGGFYFTADDDEPLMHRPKPIGDDATPSGNAIATRGLLRLGHLLGEERYLAAAERALRFARGAMTEYPQAHVAFLEALSEYLEPPEIVILRGPEDEIRRWQRSAEALYAPSRLVLAIPEGAEDLPASLALREVVAGQAVAYICRGTQCSLPVSSWEALAETLRETPPSAG